MDIGLGLAKLIIHRAFTCHIEPQRGNSLTFGTGVLMSSNFCRPQIISCLVPKKTYNAKKMARTMTLEISDPIM